MLSMQISHLPGIPVADIVQDDYALLLQIQHSCPWLHQHCTAFRPGSSCNFAHVVFSISVLPDTEHTQVVSLQTCVCLLSKALE